MKKRILYFMPDNPVGSKAGNATRAKQTLDYLVSLPEYTVEFLSIRDWGVWDAYHLNKFQQNYPSVRLHLVNRKGNKKSKLHSFLTYKLPSKLQAVWKGQSIDITNAVLTRRVSKILQKEEYDFILVSYASWANMITHLKGKPFMIVDTHDFITAQSRHRNHAIGKLLQSELDILRKFDQIWTYSIEEQFVYQQFIDKEVVLMPVSFPQRFKDNKQGDVIYVASENPHNIKGANWLIEEVVDHLGPIKIHFFGKICGHIKDHPNIVKHGVVEDLEQYYQQARLAVCPMKSGTGIKIKVIEAMSYGIPVVTNRRGVDGLTNKSENGCFVTENGAAFARGIIELMENDQLYLTYQAKAKSYFQQFHSDEIERSVLNSIFINSSKDEK